MCLIEWRRNPSNKLDTEQLAQNHRANGYRPVQHVWFRALGDFGKEPRVHQAVLTFISDFALLEAALLSHGHTVYDGSLHAASLDHSLWFHRPFRADEYLLYSTDSPSVAVGRGLSRGSFFTCEGELMASTAQESLLRVVQKK